jgi:hypothetical protein
MSIWSAELKPLVERASLPQPALAAQPLVPSTRMVRLPLPANDNRSPHLARFAMLAGWMVAGAVLAALLWSLAD